MTWFKVDDSFYDHPKVFDAPDCAVALWVRAGSWCARNLTDGFVPAKLPTRLCDDPEAAVRELIDRGLWKRTKGGYQFHDWLSYQPSKEEATAASEKKSSGGRIGNHRRWHVDRGVSDPACPFCQDKQVSDKRSLSDRSTEGVTESEANRPSRPVPSRPEGTGTVTVGKSVQVRNARGDDDLKIEQKIINTLAELTGVTVLPDWARRVRQQLLDGRDVSKPITYVTRAINERPRDFLPSAMRPDAPPPDPMGGFPVRTTPLTEPLPPEQQDTNSRGRAAVNAAITAARKEDTQP